MRAVDTNVVMRLVARDDPKTVAAAEAFLATGAWVSHLVLARRQYRTRRMVGFSDCLVLEVARRAGHLPLGTFDRDYSKLDGAERLSNAAWSNCAGF